jgi:hypothetical protein
MGRRPIGKVAMTGAERVRRFRELHGVTKQDEVQALEQKVAKLEAEIERLRNRSGSSRRSPSRQGTCRVPESCSLTPGDVEKFLREPELTDDENEQILRMLVQLLVMADYKYQQKFYQHVISNSEPFGGIFMTTCSQRGWRNGGFAVDGAFLDRVLSAVKKGIPLRGENMRQWKRRQGEPA